MNIQKINYQHPTPSFTGFDARKLKGIVMTSNYDGIADEMKRIREIENFKIFFFNKTKNGLDIRTDNFELSPNHNGCWAQDRWGIIKNTLLIVENSLHADYLKKFLNKIQNPVQEQIRKSLNYQKVHEYVDLLYNMPITRRNGKEGIEFFTGEGSIFVKRDLYDNELKINIDL